MCGERRLVQATYHEVLLGTDQVTRSSTVVSGIRQCPNLTLLPQGGWPAFLLYPLTVCTKSGCSLRTLPQVR